MIIWKEGVKIWLCFGFVWIRLEQYLNPTVKTVRKIIPFNAASTYSRSQLGLPDLWSRVESWLNTEEKTVINDIVFSEILRKNPEILVLSDYRIKAEKLFWEKFPSKSLPSKPTTKIDVGKLEEKIVESKAKLNNSIWNRA